MTTLDIENLSLDDAQKMLRQFICIDQVTGENAPSPALIRQALWLVADRSDYQIFGICADSSEQASHALKHYLEALGYDLLPMVTAIEGSVYVKFNPKTGRCHTDSYTGSHRGVLVSCQSAYDGDVNETFGPLPLDLFDS